ncbi:MAG: sulfurtransferase [Pseudanabaenaceae cyanobacterium bins.39]|nr:sulfurtransferase [Pseudanabaenaceae cyanobacterium bins.39]
MSHPDVVSAQWLHENLDHPDVVIVDCRFSLQNPELGRQQYQNSHIAGSFYLDLNQDLSSPVQRHGGRHPLPDFEKLAAQFCQMGITSGKTMVVAYDDSRFAFASRLWWLLRYMGHDQVAVLDGGFANWQTCNYALSTEIPIRHRGEFVVDLQHEMVVDIETVKARKDAMGVVLVDAREGDRYRGEREPIDPIAGHIDGAVNFPWLDLTDERGFIVDAHSDRWQNLVDAQEVIVYCGSGVTACVDLLSLHLSGFRKTRLYAGSWSDWCSYLLL